MRADIIAVFALNQQMGGDCAFVLVNTDRFRWISRARLMMSVASEDRLEDVPGIDCVVDVDFDGHHCPLGSVLLDVEHVILELLEAVIVVAVGELGVRKFDLRVAGL